MATFHDFFFLYFYNKWANKIMNENYFVVLNVWIINRNLIQTHHVMCYPRQEIFDDIKFSTIYAKRDRQVHATFLKQNDFYTPCARCHVFLFSINVNKMKNTNHFR